MGTTKRERQKANREVKRVAEAKAARIAAVKKNIIRMTKWAIAIAVVIAIYSWWANSGNDSVAALVAIHVG
ncbi:MAG: hypothetical protein GXP36_07875 [Actinobacteria bacterium]|uniref:Uncharacterized protein n=1 Tax=hydrothermal vent metagenome TaxID=652676 RepID=A0A3B0T168_9ZZZZ|nr:hypothetical protein [Actinomycetota bacterium]